MIGQTVFFYKILEKLGEGGMGVVYKAQDSKLDRAVAIKFLPPHLSASAENKARFIQEARATAALHHPNILNVYDIDEQDNRTFFVMEYIDGKTLKSHIASLKAGEGIPVRQAIDWTIQIAQGLRAAHDKNIVHRDIKPENIMLTRDGHPKIMDFGIAKLKGGSEIHDLWMAVPREHDVLGFDIPVHDVLIVRRPQTLGDLDGPIDRLADGDPFAGFQARDV